MPLNIPLLKEICETPGAPGFENRIRERVLKEVEPLVDELSIDNMGNVVALKSGEAEEPIVMAAAHMDEIGFVVKHIDDKGFIRFHILGGFDPKTLTSQRVIVHGKKDIVGIMGCKPVHLMSPAERAKSPQLTDYFIDVGMSKKQVERLVRVGDPITRQRELIEIGEHVNAKSLDNRVSVYILIEALRALKNKKIPYDFYAVFTVQEEVGIRGAHVSSLAIQPDFAIGLDTTIANDVPGSKPEEKVTELGKGVAIKIMDASAICDQRMVAYMQSTADKHKIKWQPEILTGGGTDTAGMQRMSAGGSIAGALSVPTRYVHQVIEMAAKKDIQGAMNLLVKCVQGFDNYTWEF